jgi:aconitase A
MDHFVDHDAHGYSQPNRDGTGEVETITLSDGTEVSFECVVRIDTPTEGAFVAAGGILPYVLDQLAAE